MTRRLRWWPLVVVVLVLSVASTAQTAANTVASTKAKDDVRTIGANDLKPTECASLALTAKVTGSGTITGTSANELMTGGAGVDNINGGFGNDCILGGAGNDTINGGSGTDVCIGGGGTDTFSNCETQIQ
jgi:Ca2+-binding RTX toxin-like protein